jgi:hypothetical protein
MYDDTEWHTSAKAYLDRLCAAEYETQRKKHKGSLKNFRFTPTDYVNNLIQCLNVNDEEAFKAIKMLQGYATVLKV